MHGFTGSPNSFSELVPFLQKQGFTVAIPVLPGHTTHAADMFNYTWRDWYACVTDAFAELNSNCEEVFVCGLSMGGTLSLHLAAHERVQGIVSMAAPATFPRLQRIGVRYLHGFIKFRRKKGGEDVRDEKAKAKLRSYRRFPYYAVDQLFRLTEHVEADLPEVRAPILVVHSVQDHSVPFADAQIIFENVGSKSKRKVDLQESYHIITVDCEKELVQKEILAFIREHSILLQKSSSKKAGSKSTTK